MPIGTAKRFFVVMRRIWHVRTECRAYVLSTTFSALSTDEIRSSGQALGDVFRMPDHVHVQDTMLVKAVHDGSRGDSNSRDKQFRARIDNYRN